MRLAVTLVLSAILIVPAEAGTLRPIALGVTGGTLGVGPEVSYQLNSIFAIRGSATFLGGSAGARSNGFRYRGNAKISNWGGTVDVHPLASGFRLSAGLRATHGNRIRFTARPTRDMTYSGMTFTPDQVGSLSGTIRANSVSPLLSAGYVHTGLTGFTFGFDAGVMFHGTPRPYGFTATGELATNPAAQSEYLAQQQKVRDDVDGLKYYPVAQLSLGYRF